MTGAPIGVSANVVPSGYVVVVTGATSGIGLETVRAVLALGATVVAVGRDASKLEEMATNLTPPPGGGRLEVARADLSRRDEVDRLADELTGRFPRIDVLINNAGAVFSHRELTADGHERTWALNVLAPFLLTHRLAPRLVKSRPARVVNVASSAHFGYSLDLEDLEGARKYHGFRQYGRSKLALVLLSYEFAERFRGSGVTVNSLHPGFVRTRFGQNNGGAFGLGIRVLSRLFAIRVQRGARTPVYLATSPDVADTTGAYFDREKPARSSPQSYDRATRRRLWEQCCEATGIPIDALVNLPVGGERAN
ncbi:MAG: SDR family oxidoreductase [Thermoplasmata archaeon]|nr:SDR family oxidoreductase [Thermoplasmata archaeon]